MTLHEVIEQLEEARSKITEPLSDYDMGAVDNLEYALSLLNKVEDYSKQCVACGKWYVPTNPFGQLYCSNVCRRNYKRGHK